MNRFASFPSTPTVDQPALPSATAKREVMVLNKLGLHARPAAEFVRFARQFESTIEIVTLAGPFSAKRVIDVLLAALSSGARFQLIARGPDAELAVDTLEALVRHFAESERAEEVPRAARGFRRFDLDDW